jgi:phosphoserine phosphatase
LKYRVVAFDLDGTLLRGSTVSICLATRAARGEELRALEARFVRGEISNAVIADASASWLAGCGVEELESALWSETWIDGIAETVDAVHAAGAEAIVATITWRHAAEAVARRFGFDAACGTGMDAQAGRLTGTISGYFDEVDKADFVEEHCRARGVPMAEVAAVGDSRSDIPLFGRVGLAIALNATPEARRAAHVSLDADDLRDVLPLLGADARSRLASRS